jgi:hypothetical protein
MSGQKSFAESIQRIAIGTSKDEVINVCSDEERMASDSNAPHAALKSDKRTPLAFEISAHGGMQSTGTARHVMERTPELVDISIIFRKSGR